MVGSFFRPGSNTVLVVIALALCTLFAVHVLAFAPVSLAAVADQDVVAVAPADELKGDFINTTREGFRVAFDVSVYSLIAVARAAVPLMSDGGSIMTMTYYAAEKVVPRYNVMAVAKAGLECSVRYLAFELGKKNIRVNAISAGPIKTLAARGIAGFTDMHKTHAERAPLGRNVDVNEVGATGVFLASDASSGITGETIYVDCGYNIMGF